MVVVLSVPDAISMALLVQLSAWFLARLTALRMATQKRTVNALQGSGSLDGVPVVFEESCDMDTRLSHEPTFNVIHPINVAVSDPGFALAAHFVSNLLPVGHIKSTKLDDQEFINYFSASEKWLRTTMD